MIDYDYIRKNRIELISNVVLLVMLCFVMFSVYTSALSLVKYLPDLVNNIADADYGNFTGDTRDMELMSLTVKANFFLDCILFAELILIGFVVFILLGIVATANRIVNIVVGVRTVEDRYQDLHRELEEIKDIMRLRKYKRPGGKK